MKKRVLVIGNTNMNLNMSAGTLPGPGQTAQARQFDFMAGGNGTGVLVALNKLGADVVYATRLGGDLNGQRLLSFFNDIGVDTRFIKTDKTLKTGFELCLKESNGIQRRLLYKGANEALNSKDIEEAFTCYPDGVYFRSDIPVSALISSAFFARQCGSKIFININGIKSSFPFSELERAEVVIANENTVYDLTGIYPQDFEKCLKAAIALSSKVKADHFVIKLQDRGTFHYDGKYYKIIAPYDGYTIDASSADDAFDGAFVKEYLSNGDIRRAIEYAHVAYSLTASRDGQYSSIPTETEMDALIEEKQLLKDQ
ncbi:MAG: hypothetical protein E7623_06325 [Ruminococcaceae bacterium]|nr:hypothetical protein [Oscillospiraceae bacterium]